MLRLWTVIIRCQWTEGQISLQQGLWVPISQTPVQFQFAVQPGACSLHNNLKSRTALHPDCKTRFWTQLKEWLWSKTFFSWAVAINTSPRLSPTLVSMWRATLFFSDSQNFLCLNCRHALWKTERFIYNWLDLQACFITLFPAQSFLILNRNYYENFLLQGISRLAGLKQNLSLLVQFYFWKNLLNWARVHVQKGNTYTHHICARTQWVSSNSCCGTFSLMPLNCTWEVALLTWWPSFFLQCPVKIVLCMYLRIRNILIFLFCQLTGCQCSKSGSAGENQTQHEVWDFSLKHNMESLPLSRAVVSYARKKYRLSQLGISCYYSGFLLLTFLC